MVHNSIDHDGTVGLLNGRLLSVLNWLQARLRGYRASSRTTTSRIGKQSDLYGEVER